MTKLVWVLAISAGLSACSSDDSGGGGSGDQYTVSLTAGGTHYEAPTTGAIRGSDGTFTFGVEFDHAAGIGFNLTAPLASGTQAIGADTKVHVLFNSADSSYTAGDTRGSGSAVITVDGNVITGTFAFEALEVDVGDTPISITDGTFGVELVN